MGFLGIKSKSEKDMEREMQFRRARKALLTYIAKCGELKRMYFDHGRRASELGDQTMRRQFASGYVRLHEQIQNAEKMLLYMDGLKLRADATKVAGEFVRVNYDVAGALMAGVGEKDILAMQKKLEKAVHRADMLDQTLGTALDSLSESVISSPMASPESIQQTEKLFENEPALASSGGDLSVKVAEAERLMAAAKR